MSDWRKRAEPVATGWRSRAEPVRELPPLKTFDETGTQDALRKVEAQEMERARLAEESTLANVLAPKTKLGTALRSAQRGVSMGFSDEISGAMGAGYEGINRLSEFLGAQPGDAYDAANPEERPSILDVYRRERDAMRRETAAGEAANPALAKSVEFGAGLLTPPIGKGGRTAKELFKTGAKTAGVMGLGNSSADLLEGDVGQALLDTGLSAGIGGVGSVALGKGAQVVGTKVAPWFRKKAQDNAIKDMLGAGHISDKLGDEGIDTAEKQAAFADRLLKEKAVRFWGGGAGNMRDRAVDAKRALGPNYEKAFGQAQNPLDFGEASAAAEKAMLDPGFGRPGLNPGEVRLTGPAQQLVDEIRSQGERKLTPLQTYIEAHTQKSQARNTTAYDPTKHAREAKKIFGRTVSGYGENIADQLERDAGPEAADLLRSTNDKYGFWTKVDDLAGQRANRDVSLKSKVGHWLGSLAMGGIVGHQVNQQAGGIAGVAALAAPSVGRALFSPNRLAVGADALSNYAARAGSDGGAAKLARMGTEELRRYLLENSPKAGSDEAGQHFLNGG